MIEEFSFKQLVERCKQTHQEMQRRASRSSDTLLAIRNWLLGWYIVEFEQSGANKAQYGKEILKRLSSVLKADLGRGFSVDSLEQMRRFFLAYRDVLSAGAAMDILYPSSAQEISETVSRISKEPQASPLPMPSQVSDLPSQLWDLLTLGWSHYVALMAIQNREERRFYEIEAEANQWSVRELERQIASSLYERLALSRDKEEVRRLAERGQIVEKGADLIKNPIVLEFLGLDAKPSYSEDELESAIIGKLEHFLLELGKGFLFEARQKRFTFDNDHFYVDLVFYNRLLRCYVLIDLKRDKLAHQDLGQMQMYVNYFDRFVKTEDEIPTVGIVLCHRKNDALVELTLPANSNIFASKYQLYLPSKEELKAELAKIEADLKDA